MSANILAAFPFDGKMEAALGPIPVQDVEGHETYFMDGRINQALFLTEKARALFKAPKEWNLPETGMISFWFRPDVDATIEWMEQIFSIPQTALSLHRDKKGRLVFRIGTRLVVTQAKWAAGRWNHIALGWARRDDLTEGVMELYLNGRRAELVMGPGDGRFVRHLDELEIQFGSAGPGSFRGGIDELLVFNRLLNEREVRTIIGFNLSALDVARVKDLPLAKPLKNLALDKPVTGSAPQYNNRYGYKLVTDGDIDAESYATNGPDMRGQHYIQVDLGTVNMFNEIQLWHASSGVFLNNRLEASETGDFQGEQIVLFDSDRNGTYHEKPEGKVFRFAPVHARYIRNWINGGPVSDVNRWVEMRVYNDPFDYPLTVSSRLEESSPRTSVINPSESVVNFVPPVFQDMDINTLPKPEWIGEQIKGLGCQQETISNTFVVRTRKTYHNVKVTAGKLLDESGEAVAGIILHVIKPQNRAQDSLRPAELLLKDDRVHLKNVFPDTGDFPEVRFYGPVQTDLLAGQTKQFWITTQVHPNAKPGLYQTVIQLTSADGLNNEIPFYLEVLPFRVVKPRNKYWGIYYQLHLAEKSREGLSAQQKKSSFPYFQGKYYQQFLKDIYEHGFGVVALLPPDQLFDGSNSMLAKSMIMARDIGFRRGIMVLQDPWVNKLDSSQSYLNQTLPQHIQSLVEFRSENSLPTIVLYENHEPTDKNTSEIDARRAIIVENGGYTMIATGAGHLSPFVDRSDYPVVLPASPLKARFAAESIRNRKKNPWYSYSIWNLDVEQARQLSGYGFWMRNFDGILPYTYMKVFGDPFDADDADLTDQCVSYPSRRGPINTRIWEATRAGINDYLYIHHFLMQASQLMNNCHDDPVRFDMLEMAMDEVWDVILRQVRQEKDADFEADRRQVAEAIKKISELSNIQ